MNRCIAAEVSFCLGYAEMARLMDLEAVALEDYWRKVPLLPT